MSSVFHTKPSNPAPLREFNVSPEEDLPEGIPVSNPMFSADRQFQPGQEISAGEREELQRLRRDRLKNGDPLAGHARKRIELLVNIGRTTTDILIDGVSFGLRTLKNKEAREATLSIFNCANDAEAAYEIRRQTLAKAIFQIDGQDIELALGGNGFDLKLSLIDEMEETIVKRLYDEYNALKNDVTKKYALETEEQVKEVLSDLKKS